MADTKKRIGIMGGTFDPVHNAHLMLAEQAYRQYGLDEIWMLPNGNPPHKRNTRQAGMEHRMHMLQLAIQDIPYLKLCDVEQSGAVYHYTYETLQQLNRAYPDTTFYFIMGADSLFEFDGWKEPGIISRECILLAAVRDDHPGEELKARIRVLEARYGARIYLLTRPGWILHPKRSAGFWLTERTSPVWCLLPWRRIWAGTICTERIHSSQTAKGE